MQSLPKKPDWLNRVAILGVGLLGGSVGMSLRRSGIHVSGYCRRQSSCDVAIETGAVDDASTDLQTVCQDCDVVVVASPVDKIAPLTIQANQFLSGDALITDVGSTKAQLIDEIKTLSEEAADRFVAAHPIAGSEKTGVRHATAQLLDGKLVILTPEVETQSHLLNRAIAFWRQSGSQTVTMSPQDHDERLAAVSHVPHLVSSLLASLLDDESVPLIGSGWRDMTRVAAGDPGMWTAICQHNGSAIQNQLDRFAEAVDALRELIQSEDSVALRNWLETAKSRKEKTLDRTAES